MSNRLLSALLAIAFLAFSSQASAHRLDEYLQATTIAVERGEITLWLSLTPGVSVAQHVLKQIDTDGDGLVSPSEGAVSLTRTALQTIRLRL